MGASIGNHIFNGLSLPMLYLFLKLHDPCQRKVLELMCTKTCLRGESEWSENGRGIECFHLLDYSYGY